MCGAVQLECKVVMGRALSDMTGMVFSTSPMDKTLLHKIDSVCLSYHRFSYISEGSHSL